MLHGDLHRGLHDVADGVHTLVVEPVADDPDRDVRLVLVIGGQHLDLHAGTFGGQAVLGRHLHGGHRARPRLRRERSGHVGDDADADRVADRVGGLGPRGTRGEQAEDGDLDFHVVSLLVFASA